VSVSCVLSGRGLCYGPNARSEESYRVCLCHRVDSSILNVQSFSETDSDTDYCLVVAKFMERLAVSKQVEQKFDV
jgi:hypothetical protein